MSNVTPEQVEALIHAAAEAREKAYAPYSQFRVGAALLTHDDELLLGCNVENASYSLSICAERVAATTSVAKGIHRWKSLAIATSGGVTPCGACRQFLAEFGIDLPIFLLDTDTGKRRQTNLQVLLPQAFGADDLS